MSFVYILEWSIKARKIGELWHVVLWLGIDSWFIMVLGYFWNSFIQRVSVKLPYIINQEWFSTCFEHFRKSTCLTTCSICSSESKSTRETFLFSPRIPTALFLTFLKMNKLGWKKWMVHSKKLWVGILHTARPPRLSVWNPQSGMLISYNPLGM